MNADRGYRRSFLLVLMLSFLVRPALAGELWVVPTYQRDLGGLGLAVDVYWPVTRWGFARLAFAVPNDLQALQAAKLVLIPGQDGAGTVWVTACSGQDGEPTSTCAAPVQVAYTGVTSQLTEVDISAAVSPHLTAPGTGYVTVAVAALPNPTTLPARVLGLRLAYDSPLQSLGSCPSQQLVVGFDASGDLLCDFPTYAP